MAQTQQNKEIPDAPSASKPQLPAIPPGPAVAPQASPGANQAPPGDASAPGESSSHEAAPAANAPTQGSEIPTDAVPPTSDAGPPPPMNIKTVPEGGATPASASPANEELFKITRNVNQVIVPVMIKDESGRMVGGVLPDQVSVYENGKKQTLNFFSSDPIAMSAAVLLDVGMPDAAVQKVNKTFNALQGTFSPYDEVEVLTYSNTVGKATDFRGANQKLAEVFNDLSTVRGHNNGPAITGGPLGPQGPTINNSPVDPQVPTVITPAKESHVMNDAILSAANDLMKRDRSRRKVIFIISDGREYRSNASYHDVLKVLLSAGIIVYGIGVEGAAIPLYNKLEKAHLPKFGYSDALPKYANATGGEVFNEFTQQSIENIYARVIGDARDQYTLGYASRAPTSNDYREIEVRVASHGPSCKSNYRPCVDVTAKAGYYPLPIAAH